MELAEIKLFLRIDSDDEDTLLTNLKAAAEAYLLNAGVTQTYPDNLYKLAVQMLITHWYETRGEGVSKDLEFSLKRIILQLNYTAEVVTV